MIELNTTSPSNGDNGVEQNANISFRIESTDASIDSASIDVHVNGNPAILGGAFQTGYAGSIIPSLSADMVPRVRYDIVINTHPLFPVRQSYITVYAEDDNPDSAYLALSFISEIRDAVGLQARSWCDGKRIDLAFTVPADVQLISIKRSKYSYPTFYEDPSKTLYEGTPDNLDTSAITGYVDGVYAGAVLRTSNEALEENTFYYYTIFVSYGDVNGATAWITSENAQVEGLSIKEYPSDWFYEILPPNHRQADADPKRGTNQYKLRDYCRVLQCGLNLQRGWLEALLLFRDPEMMPAGRLDEPSNQKGILGAQCASLGIAPERTFDAGVLRSIVSGIASVYKKKGTCPGLVSFVKMFTGWDSRCDEANEPRCGVNRLFRLCDMDSFILKASGVVTIDVDISTPGILVLEAANFTKADGVTPVSPPDSDDDGVPLGFIIDALGTFYCVDSIHIGAHVEVFFSDPTAIPRAEFSGEGDAGAPLEFVIKGVYPSSTYGGWPWQYSVDEPKFAPNALRGLKFLDSANVKHTIESNLGTDPGTLETSVTVVAGTGNPASGVFYIAYDYTVGATVVDRVPTWYGRFFFGEFSLTYDPVWDPRHLFDENIPGPFSVYAGFGSPGALGASATPADITMWIANEHEELSRVTSLTENTLTDSSVGWLDNQWYGYYVLPSWEQTKLFYIVGSTADTLIVDSQGGPGLEFFTSVNQEFVILSPKNAYKYEQLVKALPSFAPNGSRMFVKFEEVV